MLGGGAPESNSTGDRMNMLVIKLHIRIEGNIIKRVDSFMYLMKSVCKDGGNNKDSAIRGYITEENEIYSMVETAAIRDQ